MSVKTISLLLSWMQLGALLAILSRLGFIFQLIGNTQRELRRSIHHLRERAKSDINATSTGRFSSRGPAPREQGCHN
jgi:hypothetical protein